MKIRALRTPSAATAATSASTASARTGSGSGSIHGACQVSTRSTPGSSSAASRPRGPASITTRDAARGDRADRRAGEEHVAHAVEPGDEYR